MSEHTADAHGHDEPHHYDYPKIYGVLMLLLVVSIVGPMAEIPIVTLITAFGVAFIKAGIVIKFFMHFGDLPKFVHYFMVTALVFMVLFFAAVAPDVKNHDGHNWENVAAKAEIERALAEEAAGGGHHGEAAHGDDHGAAHGDNHAEEAHHAEEGHAEEGHAEEGHAEEGHAEEGHHAEEDAH